MKKFFISKQFMENEYRRLSELLDKYIKINVDKRSEDRFKAHFLVPAVAGLNDTGQDIMYGVTISSSDQIGIFMIDNQDGKGGIKCKSAHLEFSNNTSHMNQLSAGTEGMAGVNAALVFSTVVKTVDFYVQKYKPQCIQFYPYHAGLTNSYIILCKAGVRQFRYVWANPNEVMKNRAGTPHFYLLHDDIYKKWIENRIIKSNNAE